MWTAEPTAALRGHQAEAGPPRVQPLINRLSRSSGDAEAKLPLAV
jgi:hypothetical protein